MRDMPDKNKYRAVSRSMRTASQYVPAFMRQHLSQEAAREFQDGWRDSIDRLPRNKTCAEKFDLAYLNWIRMAKSTYGCVRTNLGEEGIRQFERAEIDTLEQRSGPLIMSLFAILRKIAPGLAFRLVAKRLAYEMQWSTPLRIEHLSADKLVVQVPRCRILGFEGTEDLCLVGCQSTYRKWFAEQFRFHLETCRQGSGCTKTMTPFS